MFSTQILTEKGTPHFQACITCVSHSCFGLGASWCVLWTRDDGNFPAESGRRAFADSDGLRVLYDTSREATAAARGDADSAAVDGLVLTASLILRRCFPRNKLPVASLRGPVSARLPPSDYYSIDTLAELGMSICTRSLGSTRASNSMSNCLNLLRRSSFSGFFTGVIL